MTHQSSSQVLPLARRDLVCTGVSNQPRYSRGIPVQVFFQSNPLWVRGAVTIRKAVSVEDIESIAKAIAKAPLRAAPVRTITIRDADLSDKALPALLQLIKALGTNGRRLQVLNLKNNLLSGEAIDLLLEFFSSFSTTSSSIPSVMSLQGNTGYDQDRHGPLIAKLVARSTPIYSTIAPEKEISETNHICEAMEGTLPIVIVGAGICGTAMGAALATLGFTNFHILEKDTGPYDRMQGYGITLQQGNQALGKMDLYNELASLGIRSYGHWIFEADGHCLSYWMPDHHKKVCQQQSIRQLQMDDGNPSKMAKWYNIHVPRTTLRDSMLKKACGMDSVPESSSDRIQWGASVTQIEPIDGGIKVMVRNPKSGISSYIEASLLIDCGGIFSPIRDIVAPPKIDSKDSVPLRYLGVCVILGITPYHDSLRERIIQCSDGDARIFTMPFDKENVMWQLSKRVTLDEAMARSRNPRSLLEAATEWTSGLNHPIRHVVSMTDIRLVTGTPVYDRMVHSPENIPIREELSDRIVLLGDSAHPMSPFKGQGANQAIVDAYNFGQYLLSQGTSVREAIEAINLEMAERVCPKVKQSHDAIDVLHSTQYLKPSHHFNRKELPPCVQMKVNQLRQKGMTALNHTMDEFEAFVCDT